MKRSMLEWLGWRGRIGRRRFWDSYMLPIWIPLGSTRIDPMNATGDQLMVLFGVVVLPAMWLHAVGSIRRLHDCGLSGWLYPAWIAAMVASDVLEPQRLEPVLRHADWILGLFGMAWLGFVRGTRGANRYGPDPRPQGRERLVALAW